MWRLNWVHPFEDGNGRTNRAVSYLVLCTEMRLMLPGSPTIPQQADRTDDAFETGVIDVSAMEEALKNILAKQLLGIIPLAGGNIPGERM
jgi:hypothetical protein